MKGTSVLFQHPFPLFAINYLSASCHSPGNPGDSEALTVHG